MPDAAVRQLVAARMVMPVLDGLDEMDAVEAPAYASRAGQAIRACNAYLDGQQKAAMVLTCRISQYEALEQAREWVHDAARIQLRPVEVPAARSFLTARVTEEVRWQPILDRMRQPGTAASPSHVHPLAAHARRCRIRPARPRYRRLPPRSRRPHRPALDTQAKIRDHLLGLYILAASTTHGGRYPAPRVRRWLGVLATTSAPIPPARQRAPVLSQAAHCRERSGPARTVARSGNAPTPHPHSAWLLGNRGLGLPRGCSPIREDWVSRHGRSLVRRSSLAAS